MRLGELPESCLRSPSVRTQARQQRGKRDVSTQDRSSAAAASTVSDARPGVLKRIDEALLQLEKAIMGVGLFVTTVIIFVNVVARYVFENSFVWAEELARYNIVWVAFIGMSLCARVGAHVSMDVLFSRLRGQARLFIWRFINVVTAGFCVYLAFTGWLLVNSVWRTGQVSPATGLPMWIVYLAVPVGALLTTRSFMLLAFQPPPRSIV